MTAAVFIMMIHGQVLACSAMEEDLGHMMASNLVLLQLSAQTVEQPIFADIDGALGKSNDAYEVISSHLGALAQQVEAMKKQNLETMTQRRHDYDQKLFELRQLNERTAALNANISQDIGRLNGQNLELHRKAEDMQEYNEALREYLRLFKANMTFVEEFADEVLNESDDRHAAELDVVSELAEAAAQREAMEAKMRSIEEISAGKTALLQIPSARSNPEKLVGDLKSNMLELSRVAQETLDSLKKAFEDQYSAGQTSRKALLEDQAKLRTAKAASLETRARLQAAIQHLQKTQSLLLSRIQGVRHFMHSIGDRAPPAEQLEAPTLLQIQATKSKRQLPPVTDVMKSSSKAFEALKSQVSSLQEHIAQVKRERDAEMESLKVELDEKLSIQKAENHALQQSNAGRASKISHLKASSAALRTRAAKLEEAISLKRSEFEAMLENMTIAVTFAHTALLAHGTKDASELKVLKELAEQDAEQAAMTAHKQRLDLISKADFALLQMGGRAQVQTQETPAGSFAADYPKTFIEDMAGGLEQLEAAETMRKAALEKAFDANFQAGKEQHDHLIAQKAELNKTEESLTKVKARLATAVNYLEANKAELDKRVDSLGHFLVKVGVTHAGRGESNLRAASSSAQKAEAQMASRGSVEKAEGQIVSSEAALPANTSNEVPTQAMAQTATNQTVVPTLESAERVAQSSLTSKTEGRVSNWFQWR